MAKKSPAKKKAVKKKAVKKKPAKKTAKRKPVKKAVKKKAPAKKKALKKKPAKKKASAKKAPAKKAAVKKKTAKKPAAKKTAKKAPKKKTTSKKPRAKVVPRRIVNTPPPKKSRTASRRSATALAKSKSRSYSAMVAHAPDIDEVCRDLAGLALAKMEQGSILNVRQRELKRRALARAGESLGWSLMALSSDEPIELISKDVMVIAKRGVKCMEKDLADELARKKVEMEQLKEAADFARGLATDPDTEYPVDITYSLTVRGASRRLDTKIETVTVGDTREANSAADAIERNPEGRNKLREQMILDLKEERVRLREMEKSLPQFVKSSGELLAEVIANLR
ncbi:MAG: hypothetical protein ACR2QM_16915 [Longimicrobiales bacterium]